MPRKLLNAKFVATVKPPATGQVDYFDTKERGLVLRVGSTGKKTWCYTYRMPGSRRWRRYTIDKVLSLKKARDYVAGKRAGVKNEGADPAAEYAESKTVETFEQFVRFYEKKTTSLKSSSERARIIKKELMPAWRDRKISEITRADIKAILQGIADRPAPVMANRVATLISAMFNFGIREDVPGLTVNPAFHLPKPGGKEATRERVLSADEIRRLWTVLEQAQHPPRANTKVDPATIPPCTPTLARGLQLILVTGQRPGEVFGMEWAHISEDGKWWDLPRSFTKNGNPHRVPLTKTAQEILKAAKAAAPKGKATRYVFAGHMNASVGDRAKKIAATLSEWKPLGFEFHRHDLRRTAATGMGEEGVLNETIAYVLNHAVGSPTTRIYNRFSHDPEKRTALEAWERRLLRILAEKPAAGNVRPFAKRA